MATNGFSCILGFQNVQGGGPSHPLQEKRETCISSINPTTTDPTLPSVRKRNNDTSFIDYWLADPPPDSQLYFMAVFKYLFW